MITANPSELFDGSIARAADEDLIELLRGGSDEALTVLFDRYHRLVFHVALRIVRDPGEGTRPSNGSAAPHPEWARKARPFRPLPCGER